MISEHISYKEGTNSVTAIRRGIDNTPNDKQLDNMVLLAEKVFEPLRVWVGELLKLIGFLGSHNSTKQLVEVQSLNIVMVKQLI